MKRLKTVPKWLDQDPFVFYSPERVVFAPQRKIRYPNGVASLVDANDREYPFQDCKALSLEVFQGGLASIVLADGSELVAYPDRSKSKLGNGFVVSSGTKKLGVAIPKVQEPEYLETEVLQAAQALADFFDGRIAKEVEL